ncbi:MAG TPA: ABC transporter permease [Anaerolineaceae bacterium]|nr:ABC transporter permease [Anaerolineaceae bacterium]
MEINLQRLKALTRKEILQFLRDRRLLMLILGMPVLQLVLYGYAATLTVYHLPMAVVDQSNDTKSRQFIAAMVNSQYFDLTLRLDSQEELTHAIDLGQAKVGLMIPPRFATSVDKGDANILLYLDGTDSASVQSGYGAAALIAQNEATQLQAWKISHLPPNSTSDTLPVTALSRVLYNPNLIDIWFILPGLVGVVLQTLAITQAALIVVRDRELGTIEPILSTPARPIEILLSKVIPLLVLCFFALMLLVGIGVFWFGVPFRGNLLLYFLVALLFIFSSLGFGLLLSVRANTQMEATQYGMVFMLVGMLFSGFMYPLSNMPLPLQVFGSIFPVTYFIRISRSIFLKGVGLNFIWSDALVLAAYCVVIILVVSRVFKQRLD